MDDKTLTLAQRLKKFRESVLIDGKPVSARAFAMSINVDQSHYNKCEKGERNLSEDNYKDIQALYGLNMNWLLSGEGEMFISTSDKAHSLAQSTGKPNKDTSYPPPQTLAEYLLLNRLNEMERDLAEARRRIDELKKKGKDVDE